ncbi:hypothetical protein F4778DRAFT_295509 [Xylariomycetidae sp. FL2044]|nr:hypothetical protein F4778DRAFT_295509 [Xylariomycetidae sp. FL2044]
MISSLDTVSMVWCCLASSLTIHRASEERETQPVYLPHNAYVPEVRTSSPRGDVFGGRIHCCCRRVDRWSLAKCCRQE